MTADLESRRLARCVALLLRHAPDPVVTGLLDRLDPAARKYLCRDEPLAPSAVTLLLRHGTAEDRRLVAANPYVLGRPLPGLPGARRYASRRAPSPELRRTVAAELAEAAQAEPDGRPGPHRPGPGAPAGTASEAPIPAAGPEPAPGDAEARPEAPGLTTARLVGLLRRHGARRPRVPLDLLALAGGVPEAEPLLREHARRPLPPGSVEALLLTGGLPREACAALLDTRTAASYGREWHRPAVRAVRMGLLTCDELVAYVAPAHRTLLLGDLRVRSGLRWSLPEQAAYRSALHRALGPALGEDPRLWAELLRHAPAFPGTLPELVAAVAAGTVPEPAGGLPPGTPPERRRGPDGEGSGPAGPRGTAPLAEALGEAVTALAAHPPAAPGGPERELALAALGVPNAMGDIAEDIRWVRACLARSLLTGTDVIRHKAPAAWALDEDHWLGEVDLTRTLLDEDRWTDVSARARARALLAARAEADRLLGGALRADAGAWWRTALALPGFPGTLPELVAGVVQGDSVPGRG
ncbi:hypothetical protein [Streptomyces sp. NPDC086023]|uniref:hypothetical protein n=1 Tax=Streptomyces sp. NPDC086023 TaxID=3365746 RepID=UPI0037D91201